MQTVAGRLQIQFIILTITALTACGTDGVGSSAAVDGGAVVDTAVDGAIVDVATSDSTAAADASTDVGGTKDTATAADAPATVDAATSSDGAIVADTETGEDVGMQLDASGSDAGQEDAGTVDAGGAPSPGCCKVDAHCKKGQVCFFGPFKAGKCMSPSSLPTGQCWTDAQCAGGMVCTGASACGCDATCKAMDKPGSCTKPTVGSACTIGVGGTDTDCGAGNYCKLDKAQCSGSGKCKAKPAGCTKQYAPVCGCNDATYGNLCIAASAGRNIKSKGECPNKLQGCCSKQSNCFYKDDICVSIPNATSGMCKSTKGLKSGECWSTSQCGGAPCSGAIICPCGATCKVIDSPGQCDKSPAGCCTADAQCKDGVCTNGKNGYGVCKATAALPKGQCWRHAECGALKCVGAQVCPCNAKCIVPDKPGSCQ